MYTLPGQKSDHEAVGLKFRQLIYGVESGRFGDERLKMDDRETKGRVVQSAGTLCVPALCTSMIEVAALIQ